VFICNVFPDLRSLSGGEKLIVKLCEESLKLGHRVSLVALSIENSLKSVLPSGLEWIEVMPSQKHVKNHYRRVFSENIYAYRIARYIPNQADIICFHRSPSLSVLWYFKKILRGKTPSIYYCYEPPRFAYDLQDEVLPKLGVLSYPAKLMLPLIRSLDRSSARLANQIIVFNNYMKQWLENIYQKPVISVGPLGADIPAISHLTNIREKLGLSANDRIILTVNRLHPRKRIDRLIQAMPIVLAKISNAKAIIIGAGPEENKLKDLTKTLGLNDSVIFTGFVPQAEINAYYEMSDIYIHLAKQEPFGLTVIEAQALGKPVIAVAEGGPKDNVLDGETGFLIDINVETLANRIIQLLQDDKLRMQFGEKARKHIKENYDWQSSVQRFLEVCAELKNENL
jgi:glycosyltransferase involved in cell wall biosynthesis